MLRSLSTVVIGIAGVMAALTACTDETPPAPTTGTAAAETYPLPARTVRPEEQPLHTEGHDGDTGYTIIGLTRMPTLVGSHVEWAAKGRYLRIRLVVDNRGRTSVLFDTRRQLLVLADGSIQLPDESAMLIKRQPTTFDIGAAVRVEFDLYYDIPVDAEPAALRAFGGPTLTDMKDKDGTDIPLS